MTREEQIENEAYRDSYNSYEFESFMRGAKWADETMIDKVCEWLEFNYTEYLDNSRLGINMKEMVEDFRKAMEE